MEVLMRRARTVVPHEVLLYEGWGADSEASYDSLYVFIRALRSQDHATGRIRTAAYDSRCGLLPAILAMLRNIRLNLTPAHLVVRRYLFLWMGHLRDRDVVLS